MPDRREFLLSMFAAPAFLLRQTRTQPIRVVMLPAASADGAVAGVRFAAAEARQTAHLLGRDFELIESMQPPSDAGITGVVVTHPTELNLPGPTVSATRHDRSPHNFRVLPDCRGRAWVEGLEKYGAEQLNARFRSATGAHMDEAAWGGWLAIKILLESALRAGSTRLDRYLLSERAFFDGHKGLPLRFGADRVLQQPMYEIQSGRILELEWSNQSCS